jgi:ankyrin repeat protein
MEQRQVIQGKDKKYKRPALAGKKLPSEKTKLSPKKQKKLDSAFFEAAKKGNYEDMEWLLKASANIEAKDNLGMTALIWAAWQGRTETCAFLIGKGANINAKDANGNTALMRAIDNRNKDTFRLLLEKGADMQIIRNNDGFTALMLARAGKDRNSFVYNAMLVFTDKLFLASIDEESGKKAVHIFRSKFYHCMRSL